MQIPEHFTPSKKRIVSEYINIMEICPLGGSELHRRIAKKLFYRVDSNGSNSYVRKVLKEFLEECHS